MKKKMKKNIQKKWQHMKTQERKKNARRWIDKAIVFWIEKTKKKIKKDRCQSGTQSDGKS